MIVRRAHAAHGSLPAYQKPGRWKLLRRRIWRERLIYLLILPGIFGFAAIPATLGKKEDRVRELLNVFNWMS